MSARLLVTVLRDPAVADSLDSDAWTRLISTARAESLLGSLAHRVAGRALPETVAALLADARADHEQGRTQALWEVEMCRRALAPTGVRFVLLKGSAHVAAGSAAGEGRQIGDLDILVPERDLGTVQSALLAAGWEWVKDDAYDDLYYRTWMHELPPLIHRNRDRMIDVHHTILPPTARPTPDAAAMLADAVTLPCGLRVLSLEDRIVHAAAHLFADGDLAGGLRNLWDIDRTVREAGEDLWDRLAVRAARHQLTHAVQRALRLSARLYATPVRDAGRARLSDRIFAARLLARDGWGRETRHVLRFAFYIRSHWLRMPPLLLARHLWTKMRRQSRSSAATSSA